MNARGWFVLLASPALGLLPIPGKAQDFVSRCGAGVPTDDDPGFDLLPQGELFCPLEADPKAERSFVSYLRGDFATIAAPEADPKTNIGAVGLSNSFGLIRHGGERLGNGLQLDLAGAIFAQFDLDQPSYDLINSDYLIGLPLTARYDGFSTRLRLYHQSSHLGDEFLLSRMPERENLSFESIEVLLSYELNPLRLYAGGESFFRRRPIQAVSRLVHGGVELRSPSFNFGGLVAALDVKVVEQKVVEEVEWAWAWSARLGADIARLSMAGAPARVLSLLGEYYDGPAPYGQFYRENIRYFGAGLHFWF